MTENGIETAAMKFEQAIIEAGIKVSTQRASSDGPSFGLPRRECLFTTLCIILKSQSHYPLNTKSAIVVEVVVGQTK